MASFVTVFIVSFIQITNVIADSTQWGNATKRTINVNGGVLEVLAVPYKKFTSQTLLKLPYLWQGVVSSELQCANKCSETSGCVSAVFHTSDGGCTVYNVTCSHVDFYCHKENPGYVMFEVKVISDLLFDYLINLL